MSNIHDYYNKVLVGNCIEVMKNLPEESCDVIFADPPYNLQLKNDLYRPNNTQVKGVKEEWDNFASFQEYDEFSTEWLKISQKLLKKNGTLWIMGSYHNIFRLGKILQDLGFWILNQITWVKSNPMPNFKGVRFTNSQETIIWAKRLKNDPSHLFNYEAMKVFNDDKQMTSIWQLPLCSGKERLKSDGITLHPTQKPLALLYRIILSSTKENDLILDPFFGTGTTGVVAKILKRNFIGIDLNEVYVKIANKRISEANELNTLFLGKTPKKIPRVTLGNLIENNIINIGDTLFSNNYNCKAKVCADGSLYYNNNYYSMNGLIKEITKENINAWEFWYLKKNGKIFSLKDLRKKFLQKL